VQRKEKTAHWGTLVGIRPVKRVVNMMTDGMDEKQVVKLLKEEYEVSDKRIELALSIAKTEIEVISTLPENAISLYIHIPFCPSKCAYCSFASLPVSEMQHFIEPYLYALYEELDTIKKIVNDLNLSIVSVYIGGGTPTSILSIELDNLLNKIENTFDLSSCREFTIEAGRPDTITKSKLEVMKKHNIDRISINPQSMNEKTLSVIGRKHSVEQIYEAYNLAKSMGFKTINMDIIAGLPQETIEEFSNTVDKVLELSPENITVHTMSIKRAARLNQIGDFSGLPQTDSVDKMVDYAHEKLKENGYSPYYLYRQKNILGDLENTGFFKGNTQGLYNICMMEEVKTVISAGVGAVTKLVKPGKIERIFNVKDVREYLNRAEEMRKRKDYIYEFFKNLEV